MYYIYKATNKVNGKVYIGQTVDFKRRKAEHESAKHGVHAKVPFHKAIQKYGKGNFVWEIIDSCSSYDEAIFLESLYIAQYSSCVFMDNSQGYNVLYAEDRKKSFVHNSRQVLAYDLNGRFVGKFNSLEDAGRTLECQSSNIRKCLEGQRKSTGGYQFKPYRKGFLKKIPPYKTNELEAKYKNVYQYDTSFNFIQAFPSVTECAEVVGGNRTALARAIKENRPYKNHIYTFEKL